MRQRNRFNLFNKSGYLTPRRQKNKFRSPRYVGYIRNNNLQLNRGPFFVSDANRCELKHFMVYNKHISWTRGTI